MQSEALMDLTAINRQLSTAATSKLSVIETDPQTDPRWAALVLSHPGGSIYHHPAWLKVLSREYRQESLYLACESENGQLLAVMPMLYTRGLPFHIGGPLTGPRLSSLPRTPLAGPLSNDHRATVAIVEAGLREVGRQPPVRLQIKTHGPELDGLVDGIFCSPWRKSYLLKLPLSSQMPFRITDNRERARIKWAINKAARLGVLVRPAESEPELRAWYELYLDTMRRSAVPPRPYRFFLALWEILKPQGMMQLLVAECQKGARRRIIAGSIFLMFGRTVSYAFNGSNCRDLPLRPNDAIQWRAINDACRNNYRHFDFGEVPEEHHDLARYKSKWGAKPVRMYRYYSRAPDESKTVAESSGHYTASLAETVWRHLPNKATEWMGNRIYSYL